MQLRLLAAEAGQSDGSWHRVDSNGIWRAQPHHVKRGRYRLDAKLDLPWPQPVASLSLDLPSSSVIEVPLARGTEVVLVLENSGRRLPGTVLVKLWRRLEQFSLGQLPVVRHCVTLPELPAGSYAFEVTARGLTTTKSKRIRLDGKPGGKRARLALDAEARLTGRILTAVGKPVANLWLLLRKQSPRDNARGRVLAAATKELLRFEMQTDKTGSFSFSGLARGSYSLYLLGGDERTPIAKGPLGYGENQRLELRLDSHQRTRHW